jgi:hypothetical protein
MHPEPHAFSPRPYPPSRKAHFTLLHGDIDQVLVHPDVCSQTPPNVRGDFVIRALRLRLDRQLVSDRLDPFTLLATRTLSRFSCQESTVPNRVTTPSFTNGHRG